ncbi:MAG: ATP-binding protein [Muribaculaceae bacterium]|nr:ATP-binding protein [Muribaculaceae bacterium]
MNDFRYICKKFWIMDHMRYPIGIQTFSKIIKGGYTYVDKTAYIKELLSQGQFIFLSRPRRFGKSLLLSTLEAYFEGYRDLFKGLAVDSMDLDWTPSPVLRFDFNAENFSLENGLECLLKRLLREYEEKYGISGVEDTIAGRFSQLIRKATETTGRNVVILVDEYDKPLLDIEENKELFEKNQRILKSFFGNLKSMDRYIRFAFITGVARFSKVSIFSDLNNLKDISMENTYADICGWTEDELVGRFRSGIMSLAEEREEGFEATLAALRDYYDGYLFTPKGSRLYNPFSVLNALDSRTIKPYWFETGTPTFLARWVRNNGIDPREINGVEATYDELVSVGFDELDPVPLMFQTGYLTIWNYDAESDLYELRFPNREVEIGFFKHLLRWYAPLTSTRGSGLEFTAFKKDLAKGEIGSFMERLATLLKDLPGEDHCESTYRAVTYLLTVLCGVPAVAEHHGYKGRSDIEVCTGRFVYVFEFKYNRSVAEAMTQIEDRDYAGRYAKDPRKVYLIAANYDERKEKRGLQYEIAEYSRQ